MSEHIILNRTDNILRIRFNRPEKKNALTLDMYSAITDALKGADKDENIRVILLEGSGGNFTSGNDLKDFLTSPPMEDSSPVVRFLKTISMASKPIIAKVEGVAVGVGTTMLFHCDLVYASPDARFQFPFVNLAVVPEAGSTYLLPRMIGHQRAAELFMLADIFGADFALEVGLVNFIYSPETLEERVTVKLRELAAKPSEAIRLTKYLMKRPLQSAIQEAIQEEGRHFLAQLKSAEAREAMEAFLEHRKPDFSKFK